MKKKLTFLLIKYVFLENTVIMVADCPFTLSKQELFAEFALQNLIVLFGSNSTVYHAMFQTDTRVFPAKFPRFSPQPIKPQGCPNFTEWIISEFRQKSHQSHEVLHVLH